MKTNIHEYCEELEVEILRLNKESTKNHNWVVKAFTFNEGSFNSTEIDLVELLKFVKEKMPKLWETI